MRCPNERNRHVSLRARLLSSLVFACFALAACMWLTPSSASAQAKKDKKDKGKKEASVSEGEVFEIDPEGQPKGYEKPAEGPTYYLWRTGEEWHLRTKTGKKKDHIFSGSILVQDGKVTKIFNFEGLEGQPKKKKGVQDIGHLNEARNRITYQFKTKDYEDGFDFTVNKDATALVFELKVDGYEHRDAIHIGFKGRNPSQPRFSIPVPPAKEAEKK